MIRNCNGLKFVDTSVELLKAFSEINEKKINDFLMELAGDCISRKRNFPMTSKIGGVWERQIQSARSILLSLQKSC